MQTHIAQTLADLDSRIDKLVDLRADLVAFASTPEPPQVAHTVASSQDRLAAIYQAKVEHLTKQLS